MSIRPARVRAIFVAILVLAFVIPWTYAKKKLRATPAPPNTT